MNGTYAKLIPTQETKDKITLILQLFNLENYASSHDLHVTLVYSRKECPTIKETQVNLPIVANGKSFSIFPNADGGNCLVLELDSVEMQKLHWKLREENGATHDYESYTPHLTLSYDYNSKEVPSVTMLEHFWHLKFDQFIVEPLNFEWNKV
jgi:2'-5' RNA ligase